MHTDPSKSQRLDRVIERTRKLVNAELELPDKNLIRQSGPFESVQHFYDSSFENFGELLQFTGLSPTQRVLDYGCGLARLAIPLSAFLNSEVGSYCGVDTHQQCIINNRRIFGHLPNFKFHHVNIYSKPYNPSGQDYRVLLQSDLGEPFDLAFLFSVFTHVLPEDCDFLLDFLHSQIKPGGEIFASFFLLDEATRKAIENGLTHRQFATRYGEAWIDNPNVPEGAVAYDKTDVLGRLHKAGFTDVRVISGKWGGNVDSWVWQDIVTARTPS